MDDPRYQSPQEPTDEPQNTAGQVESQATEPETSDSTAPTTDTQNDPLAHWKKEWEPVNRPEPWSTKKKVLVFGSAALAGVTALTLAVGLNLPKGGGSGTLPTGGPVPVDTGTPTPVDTGTPAPTGEVFQATGEVQKQQTSIAEMDAITDMAEFAKLSYPDRAAYADAKLVDGTIATPDRDFGTTETPPFTEGANIISYWNDIATQAIGDGNTLEGAKIMSIFFYDAYDEANDRITPGYQTFIDGVLQTGGTGVGASTVWSTTSEGAWQSGQDDESNTIDYKNVTYDTVKNENSEVTHTTTAQIVRTVIETQDNGTIVSYGAFHSLEGYGIPFGSTY